MITGGDVAEQLKQMLCLGAHRERVPAEERSREILEQPGSWIEKRQVREHGARRWLWVHLEQARSQAAAGGGTSHMAAGRRAAQGCSATVGAEEKS